MSLDTRQWINGSKAIFKSRQVDYTENRRIDWLSTDTANCAKTDLGALFQSIEALEYRGPSQLRAGLSDISAVTMAPFNETTFERTQWSYFHFNESIFNQNGSTPSTSLDPGVLPYNSTIWFNDTPISLSAPFLDVGYNCSVDTVFTTLGNCVCYKGNPISLDLLSDERVICNTAPGYSWGFSSYLTRLGLILEAVWMACCFICYIRLSFCSKLISKDPIRSAGTMRLALDFSESARDDIGPEASHLSESTLKERLRQHKISYQALESEEGVGIRCRITSGMKKNGFADRLANLEGRFSEEFARWEKPLADKLTRWDKAFDPINEKVDPVSDAMNKKFNQVSTYVKERYGSTKRVPTDVEVYEDINWRVHES
jgi:hypothetical protein